MKKKTWIVVLALVAPLAIAGVAFIALIALTRPPRPPDEWGWLEEYSVDQDYFTAREAYRLFLPLVQEWHEDAVVSSVSAGYLWSDIPTAQVQPDGRNGWWHFTGCSNFAQKWVSVVVDHGSVGLGVTDKPWGVDNDGCPDPVPMETIIDSDVAMQLASCLANGLLPHHAGVTRYDRYYSLPIPAAWLIDFAPSQGGTIEVLIEGQTGFPLWVVRDSEALVPLDDLPSCTERDVRVRP